MSDLLSLDMLAFAGSLREGSYNKALLRAAKEEAPGEMTLDLFDLTGIPLYNADLRAESGPEQVADFKAAVRKADALLVATPEYNHGVPGVLKNAIDWASRPARNSVLRGKPAGIVGASPGTMGTARAQEHLKQIFDATLSHLMPHPGVLVAHAGEKFDDEGRLTDEQTRAFLSEYLEALVEWILRFRETKPDLQPAPTP